MCGDRQESAAMTELGLDDDPVADQGHLEAPMRPRI
jgi:hypothetical protein